MAGPPPRAWGTLDQSIADGPGLRSTPTRVGNTQDTPLARGPLRSTPTRVGNTPHLLGRVDGGRSTPTRVGNTRSRPACRASVPVHPRARGEHSAPPCELTIDRGPPPRAWGTLFHGPETFNLLRSTPTRVGNTPMICRGIARSTVHPHARGEHRSMPPSRAACCGPPPRAWGTPQFVGGTLTYTRSTPTRVGNTLRRSDGARCCTVYPHARGEHVPGREEGGPGAGPPPRAWGTRVSRQAIVRYRSTPTRVGNTHVLRVGGRPRRSTPTRVGNTLYFCYDAVPL